MASSRPPVNGGVQRTSEVDNGVSTLTLRGKRLILEPPTPADDGPLSLIFSDLISMRYLPQLQRPNGWSVEEMSARRCQQEEEFFQGKRLVFTIHLPENTSSGDVLSTVAGAIGYRLNGDGTGEFGIIVHHPFWRKGFYTEAAYALLEYGFGTLNLKRVDWFTRQDNVPMRRWCESLGMTAYEMPGFDMGECVGYSLPEVEWHSRVGRLLEQKLS